MDATATTIYNQEMSTQPRPLACFDIDGTLFRSSLLIALTDQLIKEDVFPSEARDEFIDAYTAWADRAGTYEEYIDAVVQSFCRHIKGVHYGVLADAGRRVVSVQQRRVYRYTRDLIDVLRTKDYFLAAISQSPKTVLDVFCEVYGFDKVYGRMYDIGPQDRFTGDIIDEVLIADKGAIIRRILDRHEDVTLQGSIAVGDTEGDIPLLEMVERPISFNPNQALYTHAKRRGWEVVVERKDVIYHV